MLKRILVALSGTPFTESAVRHALELAERHGAEITGVTDVDLAKIANIGPVPLGAGAAAHDLFEHRLQLTESHVNEVIGNFESACQASGTVCRVVRETGSPYESLIAQWRYHDLTILGLRGLFEYGVVHNPDDLVVKMIAKGVRPILAVAREHRPIRRVLAAYNGSMESAKALKQFVQSGIWPDAELGIVTFGHDRDAEQLLADAAEYCRVHGFDPSVDHAVGDPKSQLLPHAGAWGADLIILGSSRARIFKHLIGDTVMQAIRHAEVPLFLTQ